jgi:hypothetical protein
MKTPAAPRYEGALSKPGTLEMNDTWRFPRMITYGKNGANGEVESLIRRKKFPVFADSEPLEHRKSR